MRQPSVTVFIGGNPHKLTPLNETSGYAYAEATGTLSDETLDQISTEAEFLKNGKHGLVVAMRNLSQVINLDSMEKISMVLLVLSNELGPAYFNGSYKHV